MTTDFIEFDRSACAEADDWLASPAGQKALAYVEQYRCKQCGFVTDNPIHALGCDYVNEWEKP